MLSLYMMLKSWLFERHEKELMRISEVTLQSIERLNANPDEMEIVADSIGLATSYMRVSIIGPEGNVLGDSFYDEAEFTKSSNQKDQPEIRKALSEGKATAIREAEYLNAQAFYYAERFRNLSSQGVVRISMPLSEITQAFSTLRIVLAVFFVVQLALLAIFIATFTRFLQSSIAKEQSLLEKRVEERTHEIEMLQRLASMLAACNSITEVQLVLKEIVPKVMGDFTCSVSLVSEQGNMIETKIEWCGDWPGEPSFTSDECWALRKGRYHVSKDEHSSLTCQHMGETEEKTLCVPLLAHGNAIGLLHVLLADKEVDLNLLFTLSEHLGLALANLNMQEKLREQAIKDPLTKLFNRRYMDEFLERELNRCKRHDLTMSVLILDIDHFKSFNDNFGHDAGDHVLKVLAGTLLSTIRKEDLACRIGGEEFAILLPETKLEGAQHCAEKINRYVKSESLHYQGHNLGQVTVSIGIACYGVNGKDVMSLVKAADVALYEAKKAGRDQYRVNKGNSDEKVTDFPPKKNNI